MATERQIAANRRNAKKSTGPQTEGGKKRTGRNALRHGLAARMTPSDAVSNQLEDLARSIAGDTESAVRLACARAAAEAELDLARVRQAKVALIERLTKSCPTIEPPDPMPLQEPERS